MPIFSKTLFNDLEVTRQIIWPATGRDCLFFATSSGERSLKWIKENKIESFDKKLKYFVAQYYNMPMSGASFNYFYDNKIYLDYIKVPWWRKLLDV